MRYQRVLLKMSGEALAGGHGFGFAPDALEFVADQIIGARQLGVELAVVVGGGNIFRGKLGAQWGIEQAEADNIGMMATIINSLMLRGVLAAKGAGEVRVMTAVPINTVAEPFIRLRAIHHLEKGYLIIFAGGIGNPYVTTDYPAVQRALEIRAQAILFAKHNVSGVYTADPRLDAKARRYRRIGYDDIIRQNLRVMDQSAILLARDNGLPVHVFDFDEPQAVRRILEGDDIGTLITDVERAELAE